MVALLAIIGIGGAVYYFTRDTEETPTPAVVTEENTATTTDTGVVEDKTQTVIGTSAEGNPIIAYHFGTGTTSLLFVGGIHGGYAWNTSLVAFELMDYLKENPDAVPENVNVTVIPVLNPDGLEKVVGTTTRFEASDVSTSQTTLVAGRFNGNNVDLNRNFDCDWQSVGTWQNTSVSGGNKAFSEPESQAFKNYIEMEKPTAVVVYYSAAGGVFSSNCHNGVLSETNALTQAYATASGYKPYSDFNFYEITGDMVNWLAKEKIPAISVLLTNHTDTEWSKNQKGIDAILEYYAN